MGVPTSLAPGAVTNMPTPGGVGSVATPAGPGWRQGGAAVAPPPNRRLFLAATTGVAAAAVLGFAALKFWPSGGGGTTTATNRGDGPVIALPAGFEKDGAEVQTDQNGRKLYERIVTLKGNQPVVFCLVPKKTDSDPPTFYMMENKVWNDLFRVAVADAAFDKLLLEIGKP